MCKRKHKVTYDSSQGTGFVVHKADGTCCVFMLSTKGLLFSDVKGNTAHVLINTVDKNKSKYTGKQYSDAHKARLIQDIISRPSMMDYIKYVENDLIPNCPITKDDIVHAEDSVHAEDILGPNLGNLKGKTTQRTPKMLVLNTLDYLPNVMLKEHGDITIAIDVMYINKIPFMMTTS